MDAETKENALAMFDTLCDAGFYEDADGWWFDGKAFGIREIAILCFVGGVVMKKYDMSPKQALYELIYGRFA